MKKYKISILCLLLLIVNSNAYAQTYYEAYKNVFGGELAKKYPNAGKSKTECTNLIKDYLKNYETLNQSCFIIKVDGKSKQVCTSSDMKQSGVESAMVELYCNGTVSEDFKRRVLKGYHSTEDKSVFWIPDGVEPLMMSDEQLEKYRIVDINDNNYINFNHPFMLKQIQRAKKENRPVIGNDIIIAQNDWQELEIIKKELRGGGMVTGYDPYNGYGTRFEPLKEKHEKELKRLYDEYGEGIFIEDDDFRNNLKLYRERQEYIKKNSGTKIKQQLKNTLLNSLLST